MTTFEEFLEKATTPGPDRLLPGAVVIAANKDGIVYSKCSGTRSVDPASPLANTPLTLDSTMWIASCTKLLTAICAVQCVEKGLLNLEDDISAVLPEWKTRNVLLGFEEGTGKPISREAKGTIDLRMLLTHNSGMGYPFLSPTLMQYQKYQTTTGKPISELITSKYLVPLSYDPGTSWEYGVGSDWAGQMVERVTKQSLGSYMAENIWDRLGMNSTTFRLQERPDVQNQRADMTTRGPGGILGPSTGPIFPENAPDDHGGGGIYSSPRDYIKVLISLLKNDGTLLKPASTDLLFAPCLPPASIPVLVKNRTDGYQAYRASKMGSEVEHRVEQAAELNYALGGQVTEQDWRGGRKAGSMSWGGLPNLSWFVDRKSGIAVLCCSQLLPPGDHPTRAAWERFESAVYSGELGNLVTRS